MRQNLGGMPEPFAGGGQGYLITEIVLQPRITVSTEAERDRAARLIEKAEKSCLVSRSMKTLIRLEPEIVVK